MNPSLFYMISLPSSGNVLNRYSINGNEIIAVIISLTDCAASIPVIPKHSCKIITAGIKTSPLRNIARNVATALREIDWNNMFPYIVIGINTNDTH